MVAAGMAFLKRWPVSGCMVDQTEAIPAGVPLMAIVRLLNALHNRDTFQMAQDWGGGDMQIRGELEL
jgi:hypothetical protein